MPFRIEILPLTPDHQAARLKERFGRLGVTAVKTLRVLTVDKSFSPDNCNVLAEQLANPVSERFYIKTRLGGFPEFDRYLSRLGTFDWALEIGYLPGVTDNVGNTARQIIEDVMLGCPAGLFVNGESVYSSNLYLFSGKLSAAALAEISASLHNKLIQRAHLFSHDDFLSREGMDIVLPKVHLTSSADATKIDLNVPESELAEIGKNGIANPDGTRRGPLGMSLDYMKAVADYFRQEGRAPTDIEIETLAQTWSEHCKHTIFAAAIDDDVKDGLYKHFIKRATNEIRKRKGNADICVSVFTDNSGAIAFDEHWLVTDKAETHNSPSALDPFGGAITGIVGVNRDCVGFGKGAKPVINRYGYCFADPRSPSPLAGEGGAQRRVGGPNEQAIAQRHNTQLYRGKNKTNPLLSPATIMEGVVHGVNVGGNCSGIPTPQGFAYFDERYGGKPLVFVGTVGLIPREVNGAPSHEKQALPGDKIVVVGGRVGKDGIHGATFSSVALDEGSPATAVQIGDPITQKKFSDAIVKEARDMNLYHAITDNGAGGLSSSIGEMGRDSGGFIVHLDLVPLKYPGMAPWEIWISESQERMTLAIPEKNVDAFIALMNKRGAEATVIGEFTDSGRAVIQAGGKVVMDMSMHFLHEGNPPKFLKTTWTKPKHPEPTIPEPLKNPSPSEGACAVSGSDLMSLPEQARGVGVGARTNATTTYADTLLAMLARLNICSKEFIATQYDHEVQAGSILKPLQGKGRVYGEAAVTRPVLSSKRGVVTSQGLIPRYSDIDTYRMAASSIDTAIRNAVAVGCNPDHLAILDNFCWCDSENPERLGQLKRAVQACYDYAVAFGTPFISGKDSMFNDFRGYDATNTPIHIAIPPTLLVSALGVIENIEWTVSLDAKMPGDVIYLLGETKDELGGSEYFAHHGAIGNAVPTVDAEPALARYRAYYDAVKQGLIASCIPVNLGGLGVALAKKAIGGRLGLDIDLDQASASLRADTFLFSESQSRLLVSVAPENAKVFETLFDSHQVRLGNVTDNATLTLRSRGKTLLQTPINALESAYKAPLANF